MPFWRSASEESLQAAVEKKLALVVYFPGEHDSDSTWHGKELADMSNKNAVFIRVPFTADREPAPDTSIVPTCKLLGDNPSRDYAVATGRPTVLVTDAWGNERFRYNRTPSVSDLRNAVGRVPALAEGANKRLQKNLDAAKAAWEKKDASGAVKAILKNFRDGSVGLEAQQQTQQLYTEVMQAARAEIEAARELAGAESTRRLKALKSTYRGTDVTAEIEQALAALTSK